MAKELDIKVETTDFQEVAKQLAERLGPGNRARNVFNTHMRAAFKAATEKPVKILRDATPRGPTGNLKRSVAVVFRDYKKDRKWFGAVGYSASGTKKSKIGKDGRRRGGDLGYHQGLVEFGTGVRQFGKWTGSNVRIGSSIRLSPGLKVTNDKSGNIRTRPRTPKGFFKSAPIGGTVHVAPMKAQQNIPKVFLTAQQYINAGIREDLAPGGDKKGRVQKAFDQLNYVSKNVKRR